MPRPIGSRERITLPNHSALPQPLVRFLRAVVSGLDPVTAFRQYIPNQEGVSFGMPATAGDQAGEALLRRASELVDAYFPDAKAGPALLSRAAALAGRSRQIALTTKTVEVRRPAPPFEAWADRRDPDGELDLEELAESYADEYPHAVGDLPAALRPVALRYLRAIGAPPPRGGEEPPGNAGASRFFRPRTALDHLPLAAGQQTQASQDGLSLESPLRTVFARPTLRVIASALASPRSPDKASPNATFPGESAPIPLVAAGAGQPNRRPSAALSPGKVAIRAQDFERDGTVAHLLWRVTAEPNPLWLVSAPGVGWVRGRAISDTLIRRVAGIDGGAAAKLLHIIKRADRQATTQRRMVPGAIERWLHDSAPQTHSPQTLRLFRRDAARIAWWASHYGHNLSVERFTEQDWRAVEAWFDAPNAKDIAPQGLRPRLNTAHWRPFSSPKPSQGSRRQFRSCIAALRTWLAAQGQHVA